MSASKESFYSDGSEALEQVAPEKMCFPWKCSKPDWMWLVEGLVEGVPAMSREVGMRKSLTFLPSQTVQ